ncbi:PREDICTED: transmembrane protein 95 [Condylura cristata]|uniref:transmembrane protein 95 n=1 Tax=Condylura cristata TaxID=143302 RepID=UPI0003345602|nr:PREDICTED: transmembrane protein 95 [Condylura cristata]
MWILTLGGVFLAVAQACIFCHSPKRNLSGRVAHICNHFKVQWKDCKDSWKFSTFALDELSMKTITEKTHRVLKVMEIKRSFSSFSSYWRWLQKTKFPEYNRLYVLLLAVSRKGKGPFLLFPAGGSTVLYNCSTCESFEVLCWATRRCFPGSHDVAEAKILLFSIFTAALLLGFMTLLWDVYHKQSETGLE